MAVDRKGGVGLMPADHQVDRLAGRGEGRIIQPALLIDRCVTGREQQGIALAQRHFQPLGQMQHHLAAWLGTAAFHEAEVALGDLRLQREIELAHAAMLAPGAQMVADSPGGPRLRRAARSAGDLDAATGAHAAAGTWSRKPFTSRSRPWSSRAKSVPLIGPSAPSGPSCQEKRI